MGEEEDGPRSCRRAACPAPGLTNCPFPVRLRGARSAVLVCKDVFVMPGFLFTKPKNKLHKHSRPTSYSHPHFTYEKTETWKD
ncbi:P2X purinoceptor 4 [Manis javanica]|nr:P2X purinoceptor 4 [Manis javanica]